MILLLDLVVLLFAALPRQRFLGLLEPRRRQRHGVADRRTVLVLPLNQFDRGQELQQGVMRQRQRTHGIGIARESDHPDQIGRSPPEFFAVALDKLPKNLLGHLQNIHLAAFIAQLGPHAARTVQHHLNGHAAADVANLFGAHLRACQSDPESQQRQYPNHQREGAQGLAESRRPPASHLRWLKIAGLQWNRAAGANRPRAATAARRETSTETRNETFPCSSYS